METDQQSPYFFPVPQLHRSSFLIMFWTASTPNIRLYTLSCILVRGQNTTSSYFSGIWSFMMSLVLDPFKLGHPSLRCNNGILTLTFAESTAVVACRAKFPRSRSPGGVPLLCTLSPVPPRAARRSSFSTAFPSQPNLGWPSRGASKAPCTNSE